jgi:hypothetical protein
MATPDNSVDAVVTRLRTKLQTILTELDALEKSYRDRTSLRYLFLVDQCHLLEEILGVPQTHPRGSEEDR